MTKAEADKLKKLADYGAYEPIERARGYPYDYVIMQSDLNNIIDSMTEDTDPRLEVLDALSVKVIFQKAKTQVAMDSGKWGKKMRVALLGKRIAFRIVLELIKELRNKIKQEAGE
jgi:hypothetical protein